MFQQNLTPSLLGIANVFVDKIENNSSSIQIHLSTLPKPLHRRRCKRSERVLRQFEPFARNKAIFRMV